MEHSEEYYKMKYFKYKAKYAGAKNAKWKIMNSAFYFYINNYLDINATNTKKFPISKEDQKRIDEEEESWITYNLRYKDFIKEKMEPLKAKINGLGDAKKKKELMEDFDAHMSNLKWRCQNLFNKEIDHECRLDS